jgi:RHS repeat-associated protein
VDTGFIREPAGTLNSMTTGGKSYYYLTDATGNVLGLADDRGKRTHTYAYGPTGRPRGTAAETVPQPYRYAGAYADPTGLYKMGHRYYDPALGRFTQPDPSGQEKNTYLTAGGDLVNNSDPTGLGFLDGVEDGLDTVAGALGAANDWVGAATGCIGAVGLAADTGVIAYAGAVGGAAGAGVEAVGVTAAVVGSCAVGAVAGYNNTEILHYG